MKYKTEFRVLRLAELATPPYNPREDIIKGSPEYEALRRSVEQHGLVEPPVVNLHNMRCIGGNQRVAVLIDLGWTEATCSVIDQPDEAQEKKLCLALNRIEGRWDTDKLGELLRDDDVLQFETGFDADEVKLYRQLENAHEPDIGDDDPEGLEGDDDPEDEDGDADDEPLDDDPPDDGPPAMGMTVVRVGHLHFKVEVSRYKRLLEAIRDKGVFDEKEIAEEMKRRLLHD